MKCARLSAQTAGIKLYHCPLLLSKAHCSAIKAEQMRRADKAFCAPRSTIWPSRWESSSAAPLLIRRVAVVGHERGPRHLARAAINPVQMNRYRGQSRQIKPQWRSEDFSLVCVRAHACGLKTMESIMLEKQNGLFVKSGWRQGGLLLDTHLFHKVYRSEKSINYCCQLKRCVLKIRRFVFI